MPPSHGYSLDPNLKALLAAVGARHPEVLRRAGLPEDLLDRPGVRVPGEQYFAFTRAVEDTVNDPLLAVRLAESIGAESFSPPVFAVLCSPNLTVALDRLATFKPLIAPVRLEVQSDRAGLRVRFHQMDEPPLFLLSFEALFVVKLARMGTGHEVRPKVVTLPGIPPERKAHEDFLGCPIRRGEHLSLEFEAEDARRPFLTDNSSMWDIFEPVLRRRLSDLKGSASFEARTRAVLLEALPSGQVSVDSIARRLAVSARTLQRRLQQEGTHFHGLVTETRKSLSLHYLTQTGLSYAEIAFLLGFREPNSFFRAFHGWMGTTPESFRASQRADAIR